MKQAANLLHGKREMVKNGGFAENLREIGLAALGFILLLSLPAMWFAWTGTMLLIIVATGVTAGILYCVLHSYHQSLETNHTSLSLQNKEANIER